jgi:hypothetical protein
MAQIAIVSGVESALLRAGAGKSKFFRRWEFKASHTSKKGPNSIQRRPGENSWKAAHGQ